jgi:hypothetical protein
LVAAGKWKMEKLAPLLEIGRKIWGENGGDTAAGGLPEMGKEISGKEKMWREKMWGEMSFGAVNIGWPEWLSNLGGNVLPRWKETDVRRKRVSRLAFPINHYSLFFGDHFSF